MVYIFVLFCFGDGEDSTQSLMHTRQILYHWAHIILYFILIINSVRKTICFLSDVILEILILYCPTSLLVGY